MEELINDLEKKQGEIYTDMEDYEEYTEWTEEYANGYTDGYVNAFDLAIEIVKLNENLSQTDIYDKNKYSIMNIIDKAFLEIQDKENTHSALDMVQEIKDYLITAYRIS